MIEHDRRIPSDEYATIVRNAPIVSVDLLVHHQGGLLLGKRENEPVKGEWFVPGGMVHKNEALDEAVHRVAIKELGTDVVIEGQLGTFEHFYANAEVPDVDGKHYLATAYIVTLKSEVITPDDQHGSFEVFHSPFSELHDYVYRYIRELQSKGYSYTD